MCDVGQWESRESGRHETSRNEKTLITLLKTTEGMHKMLQYGDNNVARTSIVDIVIQLSYEDKEFSKELLEYLMVKLSRIECREFPLYMMVIESLMLLNDSLADDRILIFVTNFIELTKSKMSESYIAYSHTIDLFIKLALKLEPVHLRVQIEPDKFAHLEKWLKKHKCPSPGSVTLLAPLDLLGEDSEQERRREDRAAREIPNAVQRVQCK